MNIKGPNKPIQKAKTGGKTDACSCSNFVRILAQDQRPKTNEFFILWTEGSTSETALFLFPPKCPKEANGCCHPYLLEVFPCTRVMPTK